MSQVLLEDAGSRLAQLIDQASQGEEVIIVRDHTPIAKIVPVSAEELEPHQPEKRKSGFGNAKDVLIYMADDFDAPLEDFKDYM